ncbi:CTP--phosphocholine cytidylyltransferase [Neobacillus dielmonensis]|uniref:CTP--phosphocholine cytidylyltransferase n=1 Tax=Neobacillus dielmonensis TaxID=1347369 RepID=UPI0005A79FCE|nr:CTP--phosphocholine cytidylyltransferase [Neobacillus dielmonensis]
MRAILLAAGMGTRLRPLTNDTPKSLVKVAGEPMAERQIRFLREKGISEIIVVTGYLHEKFDYLKDKYGVKLIHNDKYDLYNNVYTMYLVREYLQDSYVNDADVFMTTNFFRNDMETSTFFGGMKYDFKSEWILKHDENNKVHEVVVADGSDYINSGITYWTKQDGLILQEKLEEAITNGDFKDLYWDNIVQANLDKLNVKIQKIGTEDWFEIDSVVDLERANEYLKIKN